MRILRIDSIGGASGDMMLGLLVALGGNLKKATQCLHSMLPGEPFAVTCSECMDSGIAGVRTCVELGGGRHQHGHGHGHGHGHEHGHRNFRDIAGLIESAEMSEGARRLALDIFRELAEAEGKVHGKSPDDVHFHEVGAVDSIVDIVGVSILCDELGIASAILGPLPSGNGTIHCQHGMMPNPAPATVEILQGLEVVSTDEPYELVTPTGAAILKTLWRRGSGRTGGTSLRVARSAASFGQRALQHRPNLVRGILLEEVCPANVPGASEEPASLLLLETNVDDCNPEWIGALFEKALESGAKDVWVTPVLMKKNRPGHLLSVLCSESDAEPLRDLIFRETTTFGIREILVHRTVLDRRFVEVETEYGPITVKLGVRGGKVVSSSPEMESCRVAAERAGIPLRIAYDAAIRGRKTD